MEVFEPKCVNPVSNIIGVNSLRLGGLQIIYSMANIFDKLVYLAYQISVV